jgi:hypothetical protein
VSVFVKGHQLGVKLDPLFRIKREKTFCFERTCSFLIQLRNPMG